MPGLHRLVPAGQLFRQNLVIGDHSYVIPMEVRGYYAAESRGLQLDTFLTVIGSS